MATKIEKRLAHLRKKNPRNLWPVASRFYGAQMIPILDYIQNRKNDDSYDIFSSTFIKYLIISCVSLLEKIITLQIKNTIDNESIDTSSLKLART